MPTVNFFRLCSTRLSELVTRLTDSAAKWNINATVTLVCEKLWISEINAAKTFIHFVSNLKLNWQLRFYSWFFIFYFQSHLNHFLFSTFYDKKIFLLKNKKISSTKNFKQKNLRADMLTKVFPSIIFNTHGCFLLFRANAKIYDIETRSSSSSRGSLAAGARVEQRCRYCRHCSRTHELCVRIDKF